MHTYEFKPLLETPEAIKCIIIKHTMSRVSGTSSAHCCVVPLSRDSVSIVGRQSALITSSDRIAVKQAALPDYQQLLLPGAAI